MRKKILFGSAILSSALLASLLSGCGSAKKEGAQDVLASATKVGSETCTNNCHAATVDVTGNQIADVWAKSTHTSVAGVQCEDCHGGASLHWGIGPIPLPSPPPSQC